MSASPTFLRGRNAHCGIYRKITDENLKGRSKNAPSFFVFSSGAKADFYMPQPAYVKIRRSKKGEYGRMGLAAYLGKRIFQRAGERGDILSNKDTMSALKIKNTCALPQVFAVVNMGVSPYVQASLNFR